MTTRGKLVLTLLVLGMLGFGGWQWWTKFGPGQNKKNSTRSQQTNSAASSDSTAPPASEAELVDTQTETPQLPSPGIYQPKGDTIEIELSEYAGYAGLIAANGGLDPNTNSFFYKKHHFKVKIALSEEESWPALNSGKMAASATTVDVLATLGKQFQVVVPAQIGYSRGADGVVVASGIKKINGMKGKILATSQFTEADFFIRYLAQEAGLGIQMLPNLKAAPDPEKLNLVYCKDAFLAGDFFLRELQQKRNRLAGCVTWAPKTTEVATQSNGQASILATSRNLLIIADILVVNKGFAKEHPEILLGLVEGLLEGNRMVRDNPAPQLDIIGKAFKWDKTQTKAELEKIHLSNLPENMAFFTGGIGAAGSFGGIYQSAVLAYGNELIKDPVDGDRFLEMVPLKSLEKSGAFAEQKASIAPIRTTAQPAIEGNPILSKNIRFLFNQNSTSLDTNDTGNMKSLEAINQMLQVSPGSTILLRGHVDNSKVEEFRKSGGEAYVRSMALRAVELSKNRAAEIKRLLIENFKIDSTRIEILGRGWEEPIGIDAEQNRRVEAQWFTVE